MNFNVTAGTGDLFDSGGELSVSGTSTFVASGGDNILLLDTDHDLNLVLVSGGTGTTVITDTDDIEIGASSTGGSLQVNADDITLSASVTANALVLDASSGVGDIDQTGGVLTVATTTSLEALSIDDITLDQANLFGGAVTIVEGQNVTLNDADDLTLGTVNISNDLIVTANGNITGTDVVTAV